MSEGSAKLYERWLEVARSRAGEIALEDCHSGRQWTFQQLREEGERTCDESAPILFPQGQNAEFVFGMLRAWRAGRAVCPLEPNQSICLPTGIPAGTAHLKVTSATGGIARFIAFTADQLAADPANIISTMGLRPEWPNLACISLAHSYGFSNLILPLLLHGIPLLIVQAPLPEMILRAAKSREAITLPAVPALWRTWHETDAIPPNTRLAISAGAPLPVELEGAVFQRHGIKIHNFYGSSECGGIAYDRSETPRTEANYVGTAFDGVQLSISEAGTLTVESGSVGSTYLPEPVASLRPGRFETSDLASLSDGRLYLHGRASDVINVAGRKVLPESVEAILRTHPAVRECTVFGVPDAGADRFESIVACVHPAAPVRSAELASFLSMRMPAWQIPRSWWFTTELGANGRGKISRAEWRRRYLLDQGRKNEMQSSPPRL